VTIDHFGNLITNIDEKLVDGLVSPRVRVAGLDLVLHETYGNVKPGDFLALINSFGVVEIARAEGSAADTVGLGRGAPVLVRSD
jgi:S-adenosylmethionine hydrolase